MILIIEGTDGTGKTSAAIRTAVERGSWYRHAGSPRERDWLTEYVWPLVTLRGDAVLDRWHVGEAVWPSLLGRESLFRSDKDLRDCCRDLARLGARLVVVERDLSDVLDTLSARGESKHAMAVALAAQKKFVDLAHLVEPWMPTRVVDSDALHKGEVDLWNW